MTKKERYVELLACTEESEDGSFAAVVRMNNFVDEKSAMRTAMIFHKIICDRMARDGLLPIETERLNPDKTH